jgi:hypothetical protein
MNALSVFTFLVVSSCFGIVTEVFAQKQSIQTNSKPLLAVSGTDSYVTKPHYLRVTKADDWTRIWARHLGTSKEDYYRPLFEVDFDRCLMVVIFRGEQIQTRRLQIESMAENAESITVRFWELSYGTGHGVNETPTPRPPERPYAFIVLPKTNKYIVLEEKIWSKEDAVLDRPPKWKEVARLKPDQSASVEPRRSS